MEEITYTEVSLDSRPMEGSSCQEPVEQSILLSSWTVSPRNCVVEQKSECEPVITLAINSGDNLPGASGSGSLPGQLAYGGQPTLNHVANVKIVDTDGSDDVNTDLLESLTPMSTPMTALAWPCVNSSIADGETRNCQPNEGQS